MKNILVQFLANMPSIVDLNNAANEKASSDSSGFPNSLFLGDPSGFASEPFNGFGSEEDNAMLAGAAVRGFPCVPTAGPDELDDAGATIHYIVGCQEAADSYAATAADVNGDGRIDLLVANLGSQSDQPNEVLINTGDWSAGGRGGFAEPERLSFPRSASTSITVDDWNMDGRPDVFVSGFPGYRRHGAGFNELYMGTSATTGLSRGDGSVVDNAGLYPESFGSAALAVAACCADFNNDGARATNAVQKISACPAKR